MADAEPSKLKFKIKNETSIGQLVSVGLIVVSAIYYFANTQVQNESLKAQLDSIQSQISNLPTEYAAIGVLQQHATSVDQTLGIINSSIEELKTQAIKNRADIDSIERSSSFQFKRR